MKDWIFPNDFLWGAATASYQIEGAVQREGRGESTWDQFSKRPGKISENHSGALACDHYHRWQQDLDLMVDLGLKGYRFSTAWPRIFPEGQGKPNAKGMDFYSKLVDGLLERGIEPTLTLFHWDLPQSLQDKYGGWKSKEVSKLFADYAQYCGEKLGDRVKTWFTINEISCFTILAHDMDYHAPGGYEERSVTNQTIHNALLGHGLAMEKLRQTVPGAKVGLAENLELSWPVLETEEHIEASRHFYRANNPHILFPLMTGKYDEELYQKKRGPLPDFTPEEMKIISSPMDFLGFNIYHGQAVRADDKKDFVVIPPPSTYPTTEMGWPVSPKAMYWGLIHTKEYFPNLPILITENGMAAKDKEEEDGSIWDIDRMEYFRNHLEMCHRAISRGVDLRGYFAWSLMDNFEWAYGYTKRFGMVRVNYETQERRIKLSGEFYKKVIKDNGFRFNT